VFKLEMKPYVRMQKQETLSPLFTEQLQIGKKYPHKLFIMIDKR
jgi:hypothetical protein